MFEANTVFIVGAGASKEVGLPIGDELKDSIAEKIFIRFEDLSRQTSGDPYIYNALLKHLANIDQRDQINEYLRAGWHIHDAMPQAISIDNFIDNHQGDKKIEVCGKLAIVQAIIEAERRSDLYFDVTRNQSLDYKRMEESWYSPLFQILVEGCHRNHVDQIFQNLSFIVFNYDRCIEHFLYHALQTYYRLPASDAAQLVRGLLIFHPYGSVGELPWPGKQGGTEFGAASGYDLLNLSEEIKTFAERTADKRSTAMMSTLIEDAENIVFLGFAFHPQNVELFRPDNIEKKKFQRQMADPFGETMKQNVFATATGISRSDGEFIREQIIDFLEGPTHFRHDLKCLGLLQEYRRSLSRFSG